MPNGALRPCLACCTIAIGIAGVLLARDSVRAPHWGLLYEVNSGLLLAPGALPAGQAGLRAGDRVIAIDLRPIGGPSTADTLALPVSIARGADRGVYWLLGATHVLPWTTVATLIVAAALWLSGFLVTLLAPLRRPAGLFVLCAVPGAFALTCAAAQDPAAPTATVLIGPSAFAAVTAYVWLQRALAEPLSRPSPAMAPEIALSAQALAVLGFLWLGPPILGRDAGPWLPALGSIDLALTALLSHVLARRRLRGDLSALQRRRMQLAAVTGILAIAPALVLGAAPLLLAPMQRTPPWAPSPYAGSFGLAGMALLLPAIAVRGDLYWLEMVLRRVLAIVLAALLLVGIAAAALALAARSLEPGSSTWDALVAIVALAALPLFEPIRRRMQAVADGRLDIARDDYAAALHDLADTLLPGLGTATFAEPAIARALLDRLPGMFGVDLIVLWFGVGERWSRYDRHAPSGEPRSLPSLLAGASRDPSALSAPDARALSSPDRDEPSLIVPIWTGDEVRGYMVLGPRLSQEPYRRPERTALVLLARQVAAALQMASLLGDLRVRNAELAQLTGRLARAREEERKHLSRELHDDVAQDLVALTRQIRRHRHGPLPDSIWQDMIAQAQEALTAIRRICNDLRPAILDMGLAIAMRDLVERIGGECALQVQLEIMGEEVRLDEGREFALYRVAQEALANVVKHAGAAAVQIALRFDGQQVAVTVRDDGVGFAVPARLEEIAGDHLGLIGMRERLLGFGGDVRVTSSVSAGTTIHAYVPYGMDERDDHDRP